MRVATANGDAIKLLRLGEAASPLASGGGEEAGGEGRGRGGEYRENERDITRAGGSRCDSAVFYAERVLF